MRSFGRIKAIKRQKLYAAVKFWSFFGLETAVSLHTCVVLVVFAIAQLRHVWSMMEKYDIQTPQYCRYDS